MEQGIYDPLFVSLIFVFDFVSAYPFNDGNGRMDSLLTLLLLYRSGYTVGKYVSIEKEYYGSRGTALDVHYFGYDDELAKGMDMRDGVTAEVAAYLDYDGDGDYYISFDNMWDEPVEICISVQL